ncbi:MAG: choice-of-anchor D domain-containing protein, partial [Silvibacterium sp.]
MKDQNFGASGSIYFRSSLIRVARTSSFALGSAFLLLVVVAAMTGCGVHFNVLPTVTLSPATLSWHKVDIGDTSGADTVTVTNSSPAGSIPLTISSINISANWIVTATTCPTTSATATTSGTPAAPATLAPGATCTIKVAFRPGTSGALTGTLSLTDNATNTPASVSLTATGGIGFLLFTPTSLSFPGVAANNVSQPQNATLTNESSAPITITKFTTSGHFAEGNSCPISPDTLAPGGTCTVSVTSNPVASGVIEGAVNVYDDLGNVTQLYLSGTDQGLQNVGALNFSPPNLLWGKLTVGGTAAAKTVTVTNTQSGSVTFSDISTGPDFLIMASTCPVAPATLGGGSSCSVSVAFRPTIAGSISELLTFDDNAPGSPQALSLRGTGVLGDMLFTPASLLFAGVDPGQVSPAQTATLTNEETGNISLASITVSGHFAQTNNCPPTLGPQASCTFEVTADPIADGVIFGSVNVKDNSGNGIQLYLQGQGGGTNQVLSFSPNPIVWGTIDVGQTAGSKTLTVDNGQTVPLTIYSISIGQDFFESKSTCPTAPTTVPAGSSCTISLAFRPYSAGAKSEVITFTDDAPGGNQSVSLRGTAVVGSLLFNPTSLAFAGVTPNTVSPSQTATLTNEEASAVTLASITVSGHFAQTNNCPGTLAPQASCTFTVTSNPTIEGLTSGSVNVKDSTGNTTQLYLSGMGGVLVSDPGGSAQVSVSPTSLAMGSVAVGQTSGASAVVLSNADTGPLTISSITVGPDIYETANTCPVEPYALASGAACTVSVAFRPQSPGAKNESITFTDNASTSPQTVTVTGTGTPGNLLFTPTSLAFPSVTTGSTSSAQTATLTNELATAITLKSIQAMGTFVQTNDCPASPNTLAAGASCTVSVSADPAMAGSFTGSVDATDSTGAVTQLYLSGTAIESTGGTTSLVTMSPTTLGWGNVAVGGTSGTKTLTFTDNQSSALTISAISTGTDFVLSANSCPTSPSQLAGGASCTVSVVFRPASTGAKSEALTFTDNAASRTQTAMLTGTGTAGTLLFVPGSLGFAAEPDYGTSPSQMATLTNMSASAVTLSSITVNGAFAQTNNCPIGTFAANASCTVTVTSKPTAVGAYTGYVSVKDSSGSGTMLSLSGSGTKPNTGSATLTPPNKQFTSVYAGSSGSPIAFTLTNNGSVALFISQIGISNANFSETNTCGSSLAGNASCTILVSFTPQRSGAQAATLTVTDDASNNSQTAKLVGTALVAPLSLSPTALSWGKVVVGGSSGAKTLTLTNSQTSGAIIDSITTGPDFHISANSCPASLSALAAGASCTVSVIFRPTSAGAKSETISFNDNAANSPQTATLTATGTMGALMFAPGSLTFASVTDGKTSASQMATLTNESGSAVTLSPITVSGAFAQTNNCPVGTFAANASCTVTVTSKPTAAGAFTGSVNAKDSSGGATQLFLSGSGVQAPTGTATLSPSSNHFTGVTSGNSGTPVAFTLTNNGSTAITISQIAVSNTNFTETNTCGSSLAGNASCTVSVTFAPKSVGPQAATLTVTDDAVNGPQTAALTGTGLAAGSSTGSLK